MRAKQKARLAAVEKEYNFKSAVFRGQHEVEEKMKAEEQQSEHASFELKWGGEKDAEAYKKHVAELRHEEHSHLSISGLMRNALSIVSSLG